MGESFPRWVPLVVSGLMACSGVSVAAPKTELHEELHRVREATEEVLRQIKELKHEIAAARAGNQALEKQFAQYRDEYRKITHLTAVGESYETLSCLDGRDFTQVTVRGIDAVGLSIRHQDGTARIGYQHLPRDLQSRFQWDSQEAEEALRREAKRNAQWDRQARIACQRSEERRAKQAAEDRENEKLRLLAMQTRITSATAHVTRSSRLDSSGPLGAQRSLGPIYRYNRYDRYYFRDQRPTVTYYPVYNRGATPVRSTPSLRCPSPVRSSSRQSRQQHRVWSRIPSSLTPRTNSRPGC